MRMFHTTLYKGLRKVSYSLSLLSGVFLCSAPASAQECYRPISGEDVQIGALTGSSVCATQICLGSAYNDLQKVVDNNLESYADWGNIASLLSAQGIRIKSNTAYAAGTVTGFVISRNGVANLSLLGDLTISTYLNGILKETKSVGTLLSGSLLGNEDKFYATFISSQPFDEVQLNTSLLSVNVLNGLKVYAALAFGQNCNIENNNVCLDYINGPSTAVTYDGSLACILCNLDNPGRLTDGDKNNYTTLSMPVAALSNVSVGVLDRKNIYPSGTRTGFIIEPEGSNLLSAEVLNMLTIQTYLYGQLQEEHTFDASGSGLLSLNLLGGNNSQKQKMGFTTTKAYNEVRLKVTQPVNVNLNSLRIYGAFEEPVSCTDCKAYLTSSGTGKYKGAMVENVFLGTTWNGNRGLPIIGGISNESNVINSSSSAFVTIQTPTLGIAASSILSVKTDNNATFPVGTYAGFTISKSSGLLDLGLLGSLKVSAYNGTTPAGSQSGSSLLSASVLGGGSNKSVIGFYPTAPFNRIVLEIDYGLISASLLGNTYRVYDVFVIEDDDNDGTPNCIDQCASGSDQMDTDGDGIPDPCDASEADVVSIIELLPPPPASFRAGDTIAYRLTVTNRGPATAQNVKVVNNAPPNTYIKHWSGRSTAGVSLPATSGTGNLSQTINNLPKGDSLVYVVTVQTPVNYGFSDIRSSIVVTSTTPDPDPTCPQCTTPGLPLVISPDLIVNAVMPFSSFSSLSPQRALTLTVQEMNGVSTSGAITLYISKSSNYTLSFENNLSSIALSDNQTVTVTNSDWTFDSSNPDFYVLASKPGITIQQNAFNRVGLKANNTSSGIGSNSIININIGNQSGGERNNLNNATGKTLSFD